MNTPLILIYKYALLLLALYGSAQSGDGLLKTVNADFVKVEHQHINNDTVRGALYYTGGHMVILVRFPIEQYMVIDSLQTLIYNQSERTGIRIIGKTRAFLPFFNTFIGFFKGDQVAPQVNFKIKTSVRENDTLYTEWRPDGGKTSFTGKFETVFYNDRPVRATTCDKKGAILYQMSFGHDTVIGGAHVPLRISTRTPARIGSILEEVEFRNISVNKPVPDEIANFKIPDGVQVKVIEW